MFAMIKGKNIPFVNENSKMSNALKILTNKKLGILIVRNKNRKTTGIITDGQIRRFSSKNILLYKTLILIFKFIYFIISKCSPCNKNYTI